MLFTYRKNYFIYLFLSIMEYVTRLNKLGILSFLTLLYNVFFWNEDWGLNIFIFNTLLLGTVGYLYRHHLIQNPLGWLTLLCTILASIAVLYHNTLNSKMAWFISLLATIATLHNPNLKLLLNTWTFFCTNLISSTTNLPKEIVKVVSHFSNQSNKMKTVNKKLGLLVIPLIIFAVFYFIFNAANPIFAAYNSTMLNSVANLFQNIFQNISFARLIFILFGFWFLSALIYRWEIDEIFQEIFIKGNYFIVRNRTNRETTSFKFLDLKNEAHIAFLVVVSVNILLLVINIIDIRFLWFGFQLPQEIKLADLVHEGTYTLIFSILLSMAILLYYFRKNLNFYQNNVWLKKLAIIWLFQNAILLISVIFRCYYYMAEHGLAYKRIGVILFLTLTLVGLISFYDKIRNNKSAYYLLHINTLAAYLLLIATSFINWDNLIVNFNLQHANLKVEGAIDIAFTISRSDSTLPILLANSNKIDFSVQEDNTYYYDKDSAGKTISRAAYLENRKQEFIKNYENVSWLSWNIVSAQVYELLKK